MSGRIASIAFLAPFLASAKILPETLFIVQTQLYPWHEQARGYLMRYPNQPLLVEPDLPYDKGEEGIDHWIAGWGSFPSQADYNRTAELVKSYGMDGMTMFNRDRHYSAGAHCPVDHIVLPTLTTATGDKGFELFEAAIANERKCVVNGRILLEAFNTDTRCTPQAFKAGCDKDLNDTDLIILEIAVMKSRRRDLSIRAAVEQCSRCILSLLRFFLTVDKICQLVCQDFFRLIELSALPLVHLIDLFKRKEGQHTDALKDVGVPDVSPVLVELVRSRLLRIEPDCPARRLAHLLALGVQKQCDGHRMSILAELSSDQLGTCQHVGPLVIAAELEVAAVILEQFVEIVCLHQHVVELEECESLFHPLLVAFRPQHVIY